MTIYTEVSITPAHSGFGMFQRGELQISPQTSWADRADLLFEIANNYDAVMPLDEAVADEEFKTLGVEDISGNIYNQPARLFARIDRGELSYFGIEESELSEDF